MTGGFAGLALAVLGCTSGEPGTTGPTSEPTYVSDTYSALSSWLCHPDASGPGSPCDSDAGELDVTVVDADGSTFTVPHVAAADPPVDCFYVYPTTSLDPTPQADLVPGPEERFVVAMQAARYSAVCKVYAPMYRQVSVQGLFAAEGDFELAYADVLDAFRHFLANDSHGRPFLLIGHSQGSGHLERLIREEIEPDAELAGRMVAAHLIGGFVTVAEGSDVGGSFASTPVCHADTDTGCVVHYNTYREGDPPGDDAVFAVAPPGLDVACANPAALGGGEQAMGAVFPLDIPPEVAALLGVQPGPFADPADEAALTTPYYAVPGLVHGQCASVDDAQFLSVRIDADPADPRADDIGGDLLPGWGLHLVDVSVAGLDLVNLASTEIAAFTE